MEIKSQNALAEDSDIATDAAIPPRKSAMAQAADSSGLIDLDTLPCSSLPVNQVQNP